MADHTPSPTPATPSPASPGGRDPFAPRQQQQGPRKRRSNPSEYKKSLTEKQTLKEWYGLSERQFKRYVHEALDKMGKVDDVSAELIRHLERRLDNVVFRMGLAKTRAQARQLVSHGYFWVNGKRVNIPSYEVTKDDMVSLKENKKKKGIFKELENDMKGREVPMWLKLDKTTLSAKAVGEPTLEEVKPPAEISLIFEFYSR